MPTEWLTPVWPAPARVRALFTTRSGGFSTAPWDSLNLGDHVGDAARHVAANRAALHSAVGSRPVFLKQVHGVGVECMTAATPDGTVADACITGQRGVACTIMVADCLPVLLTDAHGSAVAAAHAGWRGLAGVDENGNLGEKGVLEAVFSAFKAAKKSAAQSIQARAASETIAWLGPCIGPTAFEVGAEVKAAFEASQADAAQFFTTAPNGKFLADLAGLATARFKALGITRIYGNDSSAAWCTAGNPSRFFSHRRDSGVTGRMAGCIWLA